MLKVAIIDDEELGRRGIRARLGHLHDVEVVGEAKNAAEGVALVRGSSPNLVFLDVKMPRKSGFDVIREIGEDAFPHVIFVTAHDEFALQAFRVHALDYLLKPIDDEQFDAAVRRAREAIEEKRDRELGKRLSAFLQQETSARNAADHLVLRSPGRTVLVALKAIDWIEAAGDYVNIHAGKKTWLYRETIVAMEERLADRGFIRIHRSTIVNVKRIEEIRALDNGDHSVLLKDGRLLRLSRSFRASLERITKQSL